MLSAAFHLNNREAKHELNITADGHSLLFCPEPKYLGVTLFRSLFTHVPPTAGFNRKEANVARCATTTPGGLRLDCSCLVS